MALHNPGPHADTGPVESFDPNPSPRSAPALAATDTKVRAPRDTLIIDLDAGTVAAGPWSTTFSANRPEPDEVLARYLALVYEMRQLEPGTTIPLRSLDVSVLSQALSMPPVDIENRLVVLMKPGNRQLAALRKLLKNRVALTAAVAVAATAVGLLVLIPGGDAAPQTPAGSETDNGVEVAPEPVEPEIGEGLTIER